MSTSGDGASSETFGIASNAYANQRHAWQCGLCCCIIYCTSIEKFGTHYSAKKSTLKSRIDQAFRTVMKQWVNTDRACNHTGLVMWLDLKDKWSSPNLQEMSILSLCYTAIRGHHQQLANPLRCRIYEPPRELPDVLFEDKERLRTNQK